jgi:MoaA/NifB/PqqE/SkfB family radical SAM enzyme
MKTFIWDVQYFCPLQCVYCYSNSGPSRRQSSPKELWPVTHAIAREQPDAVQFSGGEPALVKGIEDMAQYLQERGITCSLFTSGWGMTEDRARRLAAVFDRVHVSFDCADPETNDFIRGKAGAHRQALNALRCFSAVRSHAPGMRFGIECTVLKTNLAGVRDLCTLAAEIEGLAFINVSPAVPTGRSSGPAFALLLSEEQIATLLMDALSVRKSLPPTITLTVHRNDFLKHDDDRHIQLNANGDVRAIKICEPTIGNIVDEPLADILRRAAEWRARTPLARTLPMVPDFVAWGEVVRELDRGIAASREVTSDAEPG